MDRRDALSAATSLLTAATVAGCLRMTKGADSGTDTDPESTGSEGAGGTTHTTESSVVAKLGWQSDVDAISGTIGRERVFLQTEGSVVALHRDDGNVLWEYDQFGESKALTEPVAGPEWVAIGNTNPNETGTIYKFDAASGQVTDQLDVDSAFEGQTFGANSLGVLTHTNFDSKGRLRPMANGVFAVDLESMELLWRTNEGFSGMVDAGEELVVGAHDKINGRDPKTGTVNWTLETGPVYTFKLVDDIVYWATLQTVYKQGLPPSESNILFAPGGDLDAGIGVADGYVVCGLNDGAIVVDGSGKVQWRETGLNLNDLAVSNGVAWLASDTLLGVELSSGEWVRQFDPSGFTSFEVAPARVDWVKAQDELILAGVSDAGVFAVEASQ